MSWTQIVAVAFCGVLGYWLVAVFLPLLGKSRQGYREPGGAYGEAPAPDGERMQPMWFDILEVRPDGTADEIADAYRRKIRQYHPDRVAHMGEDIRQLAERRSVEINRAYETAMRLRGR